MTLNLGTYFHKLNTLLASCFTHSRLSKGENQTKNQSKVASVTFYRKLTSSVVLPFLVRLLIEHRYLLTGPFLLTSDVSDGFSLVGWSRSRYSHQLFSLFAQACRL